MNTMASALLEPVQAQDITLVTRGDLLGSGTLSGPQNDQLGCLLEITEGGKKQIELTSGEVRKFLEDGDEIILRGRRRCRST